MSKIEELKKHNPNLKIDIIDVFEILTKKSKYVELLVNLFKNSKRFDGEREYLIKDLREKFYICDAKLQNKKTYELMFYVYILRETIGDNAETFQNFIEFNERKLIENNDLTKYRNFDEIINAVSLAELKFNYKEFEKEIFKLYETGEWLLLKPLSWESSIKYGYGTRWCTSSKSEFYQFYRYSQNGILIYCINKSTGKKVAVYKDLNEKDDISFWNAEDKRIDSIFCGLPTEVLDIIREQLLTEKKSNFSYFSEKENKRYLEFTSKNKTTEEIPLPYPGIVVEENDFLGGVLNEITNHTANNQLRIVYPD